MLCFFHLMGKFSSAKIITLNQNSLQNFVHVSLVFKCLKMVEGAQAIFKCSRILVSKYLVISPTYLTLQLAHLKYTRQNRNRRDAFCTKLLTRYTLNTLVQRSRYTDAELENHGKKMADLLFIIIWSMRLKGNFQNFGILRGK